MKKTLLGLLVFTVYVLHQDLWNWDKIEPLLFGDLPVMPMVLGSAVVMVLVSLLTKAPGRATLERYFFPCG